MTSSSSAHLRKLTRSSVCMCVYCAYATRTLNFRDFYFRVLNLLTKNAKFYTLRKIPLYGIQTLIMHMHIRVKLGLKPPPVLSLGSRDCSSYLAWMLLVVTVYSSHRHENCGNHIVVTVNYVL